MTFKIVSMWSAHCFFRRSETLLGCCLDNCGEKICTLVVKQQQKNTHRTIRPACMCERPSAGLMGEEKMTTGKQIKRRSHWSARAWLVCIFSALLSGSAWSHGRRRATRTGRIHSELPLLVFMPMNGQSQMMCSHYTVQTEARVWGAGLRLLRRPPRRCPVAKLEPRLQITTALAESECASITLAPFKETVWSDDTKWDVLLQEGVRGNYTVQNQRSCACGISDWSLFSIEGMYEVKTIECIISREKTTCMKWLEMMTTHKFMQHNAIWRACVTSSCLRFWSLWSWRQLYQRRMAFGWQRTPAMLFISRVLLTDTTETHHDCWRTAVGNFAVKQMLIHWYHP